MTLVSAVSRKHAGRKLRDVLGDERLDTPVFATAAEALARPCDVLVEYTTAASAKANVLAALEQDGRADVYVPGQDTLGAGWPPNLDEVARELSKKSGGSTTTSSPCSCPQRAEVKAGKVVFEGRGQGHGEGLDVEWAKRSGLLMIHHISAGHALLAGMRQKASKQAAGWRAFTPAPRGVAGQSS